MDQENRPDDVRIEVELSQQREEKPESQRDTQVPEQDPTISPGTDKEAPPVIYSDRYFSLKQQRIVKGFIFLCVVAALIVGRSSVPDHEVACLKDRLFDLLEGITKYLIATNEHEKLRNALQVLASGFIDISFLSTLGYWILYGKSSRLIIVYGIFYGTRVIVQQLFWEPFPEYYWWYSPGFPSLVVPYGRGSDFFYSGHAGFVVICLREWSYLGFKKMQIFLSAVLAFTIFILLVYRIHYTADIFAGVFFADWCFLIVSRNQDWFDKIIISVAAKVRGWFRNRRRNSS